MSWDADLLLASGKYELDSWNYTHNCNAMLAAALEAVGEPVPGKVDWFPSDCAPTWWKRLDGMTGAEGVVFLDGLIRELAAHPDKYEAMNPEGGWGSYGTVLNVLREMHAAVPPEPTMWRVTG